MGNRKRDINRIQAVEVGFLRAVKGFDRWDKFGNKGILMELNVIGSVFENILKYK
jgi:hypothetical protein